jgi:integrase/recombinase XerD
MGNDLVKASPVIVPASVSPTALPMLVERAGGAARFAWDEYFSTEHHNPHTQKAYMQAVKRFMAWAEGEGVELAAITPGMVGQYLVGLGGSPAKRNLHLPALRGFFDRMVNRHVCILNPAASVKGEKEQVMEGKAPEITIEQARKLLAAEPTISWGCVIGRFSPRWPIPAAGVGRWRSCGWAISSMTVSNTRCGFRKKGGKSREIPVRHDLEGFIRAYVEAAGISGDAKETPLFRMGNGRAKKLLGTAMTSKRICELVKRRLKDAGLRLRLSPHSFRVTMATDLLAQNVPLEVVQYLLGHVEPRTIGLYDRRKKKVTRNIVERISI